MFAIIHVFLLTKTCIQLFDTVDGRNPAPNDMKFILLFTRFYTSLVVQDFFHQLRVSTKVFFHSLAPPVTNKSRQRLCLCATLLPVSLDTGRGVWGQSPMFLNHSTVEIHRNS